MPKQDSLPPPAPQAPEPSPAPPSAEQSVRTAQTLASTATSAAGAAQAAARGAPPAAIATSALGVAASAGGAASQATGATATTRTVAQTVGAATTAASTAHALGRSSGAAAAATSTTPSDAARGGPASATDRSAARATSTPSSSRASAAPVASAVSGIAGMVASASAMLQGESGRHGVEYRFASAAEPRAHWRVRSVRVQEALSQSYQLRLELGSEHGDDGAALLGQPCTVSLLRDDAERAFHGIVGRVSRGDLQRDVEVIEVTVVPALEALAHRTDTRVFQDKTVLEVVDAVLAEGLVPYARSHAFRLRRSVYPKREYVVQHRESDLTFVRRLLAEEGLWYFFEQPLERGGAELLVIVDANDEAPDAALGARGNRLDLALSRQGNRDREAVTRFVRADELGPTSVTVRDYNWTAPPVVESKTSPSGEPGPRPLYQPHDVAMWDYAAPMFRKFDTADQARLRWEEHASSAVRAQGSSNVIALYPGCVVRTEGHPGELNGEWLVVSVEARGEYLRDRTDARDGGDDYANTFQCIPVSLPFRPARQPRPRVHGIQTAVVVGADGKPEVVEGGDDIHTDEHGRVQVRLSWDRTDPGAADATESCWLRVAQAWAGSGWGFVFIPRIGMEVIVSFIDGDPDRPLVTGCVYNGLNRPHYPLPADKTKSYVMTQSTPGGDGSNELRFEDAKGSEEIYVHAQKDYNEVVEHDHSTVVHHDQTCTVDANQVNTVRGNQSESISGSQSLSVTGKRTKTVAEPGESNTIEGERDTTVVKKNSETYRDEFSIFVAKAVSESFDDTRTTCVKNDDALTVTHGNKRIEVSTGTLSALSKAALALWQNGENGLVLDGAAHLQTVGDMTLTNGKTALTGTPGGELTLTADSVIRLVCGQSKLELKSDGSIALTGVKIAIGVPNNTVSFEAAGITTSGTKVSTTAIGVHEIQGAMIKIG